MPVIRHELNKVAVLWNFNKIMPSANHKSPSRRSALLYFVPDVFGGEDLKVQVDLDDANVVQENCSHKSPDSGSVDEFTKLATITVKPLLSGYPLLSSHLPISQTLLPIFTVNLLSIKQSPLLSGCGRHLDFPNN